ncbi:MAG: hypothetical protein ABSF50_23165, partial [Burkholderiaceae bacterium]
ALRSSDPNDLSVAHRMLGFSRLYSGRYDEALAESARMLKTFVPTSTHAHLVRFRGDQRALGESLRAQVLWTVGKYEDARSAARMSVEIAQAAAHPPSLVHALAYAACPIYLLTGDPSETDGYLELLRNESAKHGFVHWQLWSRYYSGIAAARRQNIVTARRSLTEAFTELARAIRPIRLLPFLSAHLAVLEDEAAERFGRGIEQSLFEARKNQDAWALHELTRLQGVVMLQRHGNPELATHLFREAFNLARAQGALTYALRAAMSLQSCADAAGGSEDGRAALTDVLSHFVSNEPSPELLQAQQLL